MSGAHFARINTGAGARDRHEARGRKVWMRVTRFVAFLIAWVALFAVGGAARAQDEIAAPPRDVPLILEPAQVHIPEVPPSYTRRDLGWLKLAYVPTAEERVAPILEQANAFRKLLVGELGQPVLDHVEVRVARTFEEMSALAPRGLPPPAYASGVAYPSLRLVLLSLSSPEPLGDAPDIAEVFRHEMVHVALEDAVVGHHVPRWFNEGLSVHLSGESRLVRLKTLWDATVSRSLLPLADLDRRFPNEHSEVGIAYAESADFVRFLLRDADRERFRQLIGRLRAGETFERALGDAYSSDLRKLEFQWREEVAKRYTFLPVLAGGSFLWVGVIGAMGYGYAKKRKRAKAVLKQWEHEEALEDALILAKNAGAPVEVSGVALDTMIRPAADLPRVEHEGGWHTLH